MFGFSDRVVVSFIASIPPTLLSFSALIKLFENAKRIKNTNDRVVEVKETISDQHDTIKEIRDQHNEIINCLNRMIAMESKNCKCGKERGN